MHKNKKLLCLLISIILCLLAMDLKNPASALDFGINESEKVIFAFHKLTNQTPDYDGLVKAMKKYKNTKDPRTKQHIFEQEFTRLKLEYSNFLPAENYLTIKTDIYLQLRMQNGAPAFHFKFANSGDEEIPYFPYPFAEDWIAVITKDLNRFASIALSEEQYSRARSFFQLNEIYKGKLDLELRPISADKNSPVLTRDGANQWLMLADIAFLEFIYRNPQTGEKESVFGEYKASWYRPSREQ